MPWRLAPLLAGLALLAACTTVPAPVIEPVREELPPPPPPPPGMELLLQQPAETATGLLGQPRLDKVEGISRQLQFRGDCVLDVWYYPTGTGTVALHADARFPDGSNVDAGECLRLLLPEESPPPAPAATAE